MSKVTVMVIQHKNLLVQRHCQVKPLITNILNVNDGRVKENFSASEGLGDTFFWFQLISLRYQSPAINNKRSLNRRTSAGGRSGIHKIFKSLTGLKLHLAYD